MGAYACYQKGTTMQEVIALAKELKQLSQKTYKSHNVFHYLF